MQQTQCAIGRRLSHWPALIGLVLLSLARTPAPAAERPGPQGSQENILVTTIEDNGPGSLREAIRLANQSISRDTIVFDAVNGPFATPQTIELASELPELAGELIIDGYIKGRLWKPSGVTVSGAGAHRVFSVARGAKVTLSSLSVTEGRAPRGGGIANWGDLIVKGVTLLGNVAEQDGGGIANLGGRLTVINSSFVTNRAGTAGGGLADDVGMLSVTNCTFTGNAAQQGGGLFSSGSLLLRNTILADSPDGADCLATGKLIGSSTNNLIEVTEGCGEPIITADPKLATLGSYNGPTPTLPLGGGSPAINMGDNASAVDEHGVPLKWDQRGNGDPRFVGGITDIGAYERQELPALVIDTLEDTEMRACSRTARGDCSLRGAVNLVNAAGNPAVITFDPKVFSVPRTLELSRALPDVGVDLRIDARKTAGVKVSARRIGLRELADGRLTLQKVTLNGVR